MPVKPNFFLVGRASSLCLNVNSSRQAQVQGEVVLGHIELNGQGSQPSHKSGKSGSAAKFISGAAKNA